MAGHRRTALLAALALALAPSVAAGAGDPPASSKRPLPDYDGLPDPPPTAGEVVAWVPRVVFFPLWVVSEFVIRRPLGWLIVQAERGNWPSAIVSFFTFGNQNFGLVPTFYIDLGFRPFFGLYFFWDRAGHPRHSMRFRAAGTVDGFSFSVADRWQTDDLGSTLQLLAAASLVPDHAFFGIGPLSLDSDLVRYGLFRASGEVAFNWRLAHGARIRAGVEIRRMSFRDDFAPDYTPLRQTLELVLDSRPRRPGSQTGVRFHLAGEHGSDLEGGADWLEADATLGGFWDIAEMKRIIGVTVTAALAEPVSGEIPFLELVAFGGNGLAMPGLRPDRLLGRSALSASLRYEWPIWVFAGGIFQLELGNVFGPRFEGLEADRLRLSAAIGLRSSGSQDHGLQMLVGVGTETFEQGAALTSVRFSLGGTYGF